MSFGTVEICPIVYKIAYSLARKLSSRFGLTKWIMYRNCKDRVQFRVIGDKEVVSCIPLGLSVEVNRYKNGILRDRIDIALEAFAFFESQYVLCNRKMHKHTGNRRLIQAEMYMDIIRFQNAVTVSPPFRFLRYHGEENLHDVIEGIPVFFKLWDMKKFNRMSGESRPFQYYRDHVFKHSYNHRVAGLPWVETKIVPLHILAMRAASIYNRMFTGDRLGQYTVMSTQNLYPDKFVRLMKKFDRPTRTVDSKLTGILSVALSRGTKRLFNYMGTDKYFGKLVWKFREGDITEMVVPQQSSSGIRSGKVIREEDPDGVVRVITPNGTKGDQEVVVKRKMLEVIDNFNKTGRYELPETASCVCMKLEMFNCCSTDEAERDKHNHRCRQFFIKSFTVFMNAYLAQKDRQMFERGRCIKVGMRWWHGGAKYFADQMKYELKDMVWCDGDYKSLDTTIKKFLLEYYSTSARVYYDAAHSENFRLYLAILECATNHLGVHLVHLFGSSWKLMFGCMPSGAFETSHGNSWIVALLFWTYVEYQCLLYPNRYEQVLKAYNEGRIEFPCYGDDHMMGIAEEIFDIINEEGYAMFVSKFFDMEISKIRSRIPFLSVPDNHGSLSTRGAVFLKRYVIKNPGYVDLPDVLPYKDINDVYVKLAWGNNPRATYADYALSAIGLAYDSMGTNLELYTICKEMFLFCVAFGKLNTMQDLTEAFFTLSSGVSRDLTRIVRKCGISIDDLLKGFPTRTTLLRMHVYDKHYVDFTPPFGRYTPADMYKWDK